MKNTQLKSAAIAALTIASISVFAASVKLKGGAATFSDQGTTAEVCGRLTGLGNQDVTLRLVGTGITTVACVNPAGNFAPGNPGSVTVGGVATIPKNEIKNGNLSFCISTAEPLCQSARECGCPNNNWDATVTDVSFSSLTLIVEQGGKVVLRTSVL